MNGAKKSFQKSMKPSTATVATAGIISGTMIWPKMRSVEQPSISAAWSSSSGIDLMNCRNRKIRNAPPPKNQGMISGL